MVSGELLGPAELRRVMATFRDALDTHAAELNRWNVYPVADGDTGTNLARTVDVVVDELAAAAAGMRPTCEAISHGSLMGARGNSGVILSQVLRGLVRPMADSAVVDATVLAAGLQEGAAGAYQAVLRPVEGTMLTVVREAANAADRSVVSVAGLVEMFRVARDAGDAALARTPDLLPVLAQAGVVDAGGAGFLLLLDAALAVLAGEPVPAPVLVVGDQRAPVPESDLAGSGLRYEVMYLLALADDRIGAFRAAWGALGDSIVVVGGDGTWNCHVHTDDVGGAIEAALSLGGRPHDIRVTDLLDQVRCARMAT